MAAKMVPKWIQSRSKKRWKRKKEKKKQKLHWRLSGSTILRDAPARKGDDLAAEVDKKTYPNRSQNQSQFSSRYWERTWSQNGRQREPRWEPNRRKIDQKSMSDLRSILDAILGEIRA